MSNAGAKVRAVAAEVIDAVVSGGKSLDAALLENEGRVAQKDCSLLRMLCFGTLRHHWCLQSWADQLLTRPLKRRDRVVRALLVVGLYQLVDTRIPDHAVVSQTVEATRQLRRPKLAGLMNACLRRFMREEIGTSEPENEPASWNHPQWIIDCLKTDWPDDWQAILTANNARAPMWLRANAQRHSAAQYVKKLAGADIAAQLLPGVPDAVRLAEPVSVEDVPGFVDGDASVQDAAAQIAGRWLSTGLRGRVLDACAAPGGKTGHLLELGGDNVTLVAVDSDKTRLVSVSDNLARIGCDATIIAADASKPEEWWDEVPFDGILLDAPCSASGVIRRHPDIKLLRRESDLEGLSALQERLLRALWPLLVPGGRLLYATCSVIAAENEAVVGRFLKDHDDAFENDVLPNNNIRDLMRRRVCGYQILPGTADMDGFYYACLEKKKI